MNLKNFSQKIKSVLASNRLMMTELNKPKPPEEIAQELAARELRKPRVKK